MPPFVAAVDWTSREMSGSAEGAAIPETCDRAQMAKWGDAVARAARHRPCACRSDVTEHRNPSDPPAPARKKKVRRRRRRSAAAPVFPSVLKVEIQNLEGLGRLDPAADERTARLAEIRPLVTV